MTTMSRMGLPLLLLWFIALVAWLGVLVQGVGIVFFARWAWRVGFTVFTLRLDGEPGSLELAADRRLIPRSCEEFRFFRPAQILFRPNVSRCSPLTLLGTVAVRDGSYMVEGRLPLFSSLFLGTIGSALLVALARAARSRVEMAAIGAIGAVLLLLATAAVRDERRRLRICVQELQKSL